ncbi:hypothetical protein [Cellulomonas sp. NS3]|uniref:hypothetical protein n=1 Tax=Cellulomonas sp. NS3 TaxID=2973977 RepID=UPI0021633454|nr:hypothetical protein [Cellulomonas sp. NS3]
MRVHEGELYAIPSGPYRPTWGPVARASRRGAVFTLVLLPSSETSPGAPPVLPEPAAALGAVHCHTGTLSTSEWQPVAPGPAFDRDTWAVNRWRWRDDVGGWAYLTYADDDPSDLIDLRYDDEAESSALPLDAGTLAAEHVNGLCVRMITERVRSELVETVWRVDPRGLHAWREEMPDEYGPWVDTVLELPGPSTASDISSILHTRFGGSDVDLSLLDHFADRAHHLLRAPRDLPAHSLASRRAHALKRRFEYMSQGQRRCLGVR